MPYEPLMFPEISVTGAEGSEVTTVSGSSGGGFYSAVSRPDFSAALAYITQSADSIVKSANGFINDLGDLRDIDFSSVGDFPDYASIYNSLGTAAISGPNPSSPSIDTNFQYLIDRLNSLSAPEAPTETFDYSDPGWAFSENATRMYFKLLDDLVNGGYGIDTADEVSLWNRERDRETLLMQSEIAEVRRQAASSGFALPPGALFAQMERARQKYMDKVGSVNRDIGLKRADLYVQNRQKTFENVLKSEQMAIDLYNAIQNRALDTAKASVQMGIALFDAGTKAFVAEIESVKSQIAAKIDSSELQIKTYAADVQSYSAYVNAVAVFARTAVEAAKIKQENDVTQFKGRQEIIKFRLEQLRATTENLRDINKYAVDFFRTALGTAMSGINGMAVQTGTV